MHSCWASARTLFRVRSRAAPFSKIQNFFSLHFHDNPPDRAAPRCAIFQNPRSAAVMMAGDVFSPSSPLWGSSSSFTTSRNHRPPPPGTHHWQPPDASLCITPCPPLTNGRVAAYARVMHHLTHVRISPRTPSGAAGLAELDND